MVTRLTGLKKDRQRIASRKKTDQRRRAALKKLAKEIAEAREQVKQGKTYTSEEIMKIFGL